MIKKVGYVALIIIAFVFGTQIDINFETSQVFTSDVIAVVNNDQKVKYLDGNLKLGDNLVSQLKNAESHYDFQTTSSVEADRGLGSGKYGAEITIPSNFTKSIVSVNAQVPKSTEITYTMNNKLSPSDSKKMEDIIVSNISSFEENVIYMYIYSIFDGLHATQEGVETVGQNSQPIFTFLKDLGDIDIVSNHEYKLEDNNTDSFTAIDISKQLSAFAETVDSYKTEIANVIKVYKDENDSYSSLVDESMGVMSENDELLNDRISNIEDTLDSIVKSDTQYTTDDFSVTDTKRNLTKIIQEYLGQLLTVNDTYDQNEDSIGKISSMNDSLDILNKNKLYKGLESLLVTRLNYYTSLDKIVTTCLSEDDENIARECIDKSIGAYKSNYTDYDNIIKHFKDEENYYQSMTYYLEHIGSEASSKEASSEKQTFSLPITNTESNSQEQKVKTGEEVELTATSFGENLTADETNENNVIGVHLSNTSDVSSLTIDISSTRNISKITPIVTSLDNCEVTVSGDQIKIRNIEGSELNLLFDVDKTFNNMGSKIKLEYNGLVQEVTINDKNPLTVKATTNDSGDVTFDFAYTLQTDEEKVDYTKSSLLATNELDKFKVSDNADGAITPLADGFEINGSGKAKGDVIKFQITGKNIIGSGITIENYMINDTKFSFPIVLNNVAITTSLQVSDDPYYISEDRITKSNDDIDSNGQVEPGESIGLKYSINFETDKSYSISKLKFTTALLTPNIKPTDVIVEVGDTINNPKVDIRGDSITVNFSSPIKSTETLEESSDGKYELPIYIYVNANVESSVGLDDLEEKHEAVFKDLEVTSNENSYQTHLEASRNVDLAIGNVSLDSVKYTMDDTMDDVSCLSAEELSECNLEAGERITKTTTIINNDNEAAAGLVLEDNLIESDLLIPSKIDYTLNSNEEPFTFDPKEYINVKIHVEDRTHIEISMPANSTLTIKEGFEVSEDVDSPSKINNTTTLTQYTTSVAMATTDLNISPISIQVSVQDERQATEDGVITPNEAASFTIEVKNESTRSISHKQSIHMNKSDVAAISSIQIISVEDEAWNPIIYSLDGTDGITVDRDLAPSQKFTIKLRIDFSDLSSATSDEKLSFTSRKESVDETGTCVDDNCDSVDYYLAGKPDYLQMARDQEEDKAVLNGDTYKPSLEQTKDIIYRTGTIFKRVVDLKDTATKYESLDKNLDKFTELDNTAIKMILDSIKDNGLGFETKDDTDPLANYEYCSINTELSCKLFRLYNKITTKETVAKTHYLEVLNTIDPNLEEQIGIKPSEDGDELQPSNIGADFNGYGECQVPESEVGSDVSPEDCEYSNPGINERIDMQDKNIENVEDNINKILDNETEKVDEEQYKQKTTEINKETNQVMDKVETENNELFGKKIDIYNDNYKAVMKYVKEISDDPTYADAIKSFEKDEKGRQEESKAILENVYNLLPNTYLDGIPNKLVYSFISKPFSIDEVSDKQPITKITDSQHPWILIAILIVFMITVILIGILYYINREV